MSRALALVWLLVVLAACVHVGVVTSRGLPLQTDLMALLPREDRDPVLQRAKDAAAEAIAQRVVILVGDEQREAARAAASSIRDALANAGLLLPGGDVPGADAVKRLGAAYFPHRAGLISEADRRRLLDGQGESLVARALSQVFGFAGMADGRLLARDPFLLFPAFLADLPVPASRLSLDEGWPSVTEDGRTWVLVTGRLAEKSTALAFQKRFTAVLDGAVAAAERAEPGLRVLRLGALFYAQAGAEQAMADSAIVGLVSLAGTVVLLILAFRALTPLVLGVAAIGVGAVTALSACLLLFGELHVAAQLFGASLIGIAVDYALLYFGQMFSPRAEPRARLRHVLAGITLGMATTVVGYATLALSPFPGLHQVAVFSGVGLVGSFLTVVLWFPLLDRTPSAPLGALRRRLAEGLWAFWFERRFRRARAVALLLAVGIGAAGFARVGVDDDVRHQQALSPPLVAQQAEIQRLAGFGQTGQFFVIEGAGDQQALRREEALGDRLAPLVAKGALAGWQSPARFVPSQARQDENRRLVAERLTAPHLAELRARLGMDGPAPEAGAQAAPLTLAEVSGTGALPLLSALVPETEPANGRALHIVTLDGLKDAALVRSAADGLEGVRFVDPTGDLTRLLGAYRHRAVTLLALSALLMVPLLAWRYGLAGALVAMAPPVAAVVLAPAVLALFGLPFTFFAAMALVLVLSIGVDYAVFCAEDDGRRDPVTLAAVLLAMGTTVLSFGLMAASGVAGVRSFGAAMAVGVPLAFLLAPLGGYARPRKGRW
ncbi:MAG: MMPL family transporter [Magnetospirillum sp.]|nr:MMPL family transporter [Magnetospirillum sp.]